MKETTKQAIVLASIGLSALPLALSVAIPTAWSAKSTSLYFSAIIGFVGAAFLLWDYILGTRSVTGRILRDQAWTLRIHKFLGIYGTLFLFLHPLLVMYGYGENLFYIFVPHLNNGFERAVSWGRLAFIIMLLIWVTSALVRGKIAYRPWKYIHYLSYVALPAVLVHSPHVGTTLSRSRFSLDYWYGIVVVFLVFSALRLRHIFGFGKEVFEVTENKLIGEDIYMMRLKSESAKLSALPGQYIYIQRGLWSEDHPFSVLDFDRENGEIAIAYKRVGSFTEKLSATQKGSSILLDGSYGVFTESIGLHEPTIFIAGGIGITPFLWHLRNMRSEDILLFYCNRTSRSGVFRTYLQNILGNSRYIDVFSNEITGAEQPQTEIGYFSSEILRKYTPDPTRFTYYICGPSGLMKSTVSILKDAGVTSNRIHTEEFGF